MNEKLGELQKDVKRLMAGKATWPYTSVKQIDPTQLPGMDEETIKTCMDLIFRVMGPKAEAVATITGYWDPNLPLKMLTERAQRLCALYKRYKIKT